MDNNSPRDNIPNLPIIVNSNRSNMQRPSLGSTSHASVLGAQQGVNETIQPILNAPRQTRSRSASYTRSSSVDQRNNHTNPEETVPKSLDFPTIGIRKGNTSPKQESELVRDSTNSSLNTSLHRSSSVQNIRGHFDLNPDEVERNVNCNVHALSLRIKELEQICKNAQENCTKLEKQIEEQQTKHRNDIEMLQRKMQLEIATIKQSLDNTKSELKNKCEKLIVMEKNYKLTNRTNKELNSKISALEEQIKQQTIAQVSTLLTTPRPASRGSPRLSSNASPRTSPTKINTPSNSWRSSVSYTVQPDYDAALRDMADKEAHVGNQLLMKNENEELRAQLDTLETEYNIKIAEMGSALEDNMRQLKSSEQKLRRIQQEFKCLEADNKGKDVTIAILRHSLHSKAER